MAIVLPKDGAGLTADAVQAAIAAHINERRLALRKEMENPATEHRRRDVIAGALAELEKLESPPDETRAPEEKPSPPLYG